MRALLTVGVALVAQATVEGFILQQPCRAKGYARGWGSAVRSLSKDEDDTPPPTEHISRLLESNGELDYIFENNRKWVEDTLVEDPETFKRLAQSQSPKYMYIGCSDSRVPAQNMMGLTTGELFVVRNVANLCVNTDHSLLAALTYAVEVLQVTDVIVCGHYNCGGVKAAMENVDHGLLEHWLLNIRNVQRLHLDELQKITDSDERHRLNLFANPIVQKKQASGPFPRIWGWVCDVSTGLIKELKIDFKSEIRKYQEIYRLYEFPRSGNTGMEPRKSP